MQAIGANLSSPLNVTMNKPNNEQVGIIAELMPASSPPVRELLIDAGLDVSDWDYSKDNELLANPNSNSYKNSFWSFSHEKITVLCIWLHELSTDMDGIYYGDNMQKLANEELNQRNQVTLSGPEKTRHANREKKARHFHLKVFEAYRDRREVRVIILGKDVGIEGRAERAEGRLLDNSPWHVEYLEHRTGDFRLRRGAIPNTAPLSEDELEDLIVTQKVMEIAADENLSATEKEAITKARVGQGLFRTGLMNRWKDRCAVTGCQAAALLVASHIVPWSQCTTKAQRLEPSNGLLLAAPIDKLFDLGYISFDEQFKIVISKDLKILDQKAFGVDPSLSLKQKPSDIQASLKWHRENIFEKWLRKRPD
ncbi:hypothetical protein GTP81_26140 [Rugamonas sp. FT107W]|uniref:HNH nuclease domain-containing protein n=1 Tax=Duganella vulcania TaxID=2692166 RepID=A0A845HS32_9BURK|nr:HNH endonuclease [Duganella vulcania]MYN20229.1 hypothetical protein [Duganella vulcania]